MTYLSDVDGWIQTVTYVHHYSGPQVLPHKVTRKVKKPSLYFNLRAKV